MSITVYPLRLTHAERRQFGQAAKAEGKTLADFFRTSALARAAQIGRRPAILDYPEINLSTEAENDPKKFIRRKLKAQRELYR
jgi:uncharacterized protein (DUF1778 family)